VHLTFGIGTHIGRSSFTAFQSALPLLALCLDGHVNSAQTSEEAWLQFSVACFSRIRLVCFILGLVHFLGDCRLSVARKKLKKETEMNIDLVSNKINKI
jgi:hypothetical protein